MQAKSFYDELQDTLQQLSEIDAQLVTSQPVGGLPDTARKQLEQFQVSGTQLCLEKSLTSEALTFLSALTVKCHVIYELLS